MYKDKLNSVQQQAIEVIDRPLKVIAGAGSGKTIIIINKIIYLLKNGILPEKIFVLTFSNKACKEIKERLCLYINEEDIVSKIAIYTYHGLCFRILREDIKILGFPKIFKILDDREKNEIILTFYRDLSEDKKIDKKNVKKITDLISNFKISNKSFNEVFFSHFSSNKNNVLNLYERIKDQYIKFLKENKALDFDDLILFTYILFKNIDILEKWRNKIGYLLIDEFQDTNDMQLEIIKLLTQNKNTITVVGDPNQNIYGWRGSNVEIINNFEKYYNNTLTIKLNLNYRSNSSILSLANDLIKKNYINKSGKISKEINPLVSVYDQKNIEKPTISGYLTYYEEVMKMCEKIQYLVKNKKYQYRDILVLYRNRYSAKGIEFQFKNNSIPYYIIGPSFFKSEVVKDLIALISAIYIHDDISVKRLFKLYQGFGIKKILEIETIKQQYKFKSFYDVIMFKENKYLKNITYKKVLPIIKLFNDFKINKNPAIYNTLNSILELINYENIISKSKPETLKNIDLFKEYIKKFELENQNILSKERFDLFLDNILLNETNVILNSEKLKLEKDAVRVMTIHSAKGLESKVVFILKVCENIIPSFLSKINNLVNEERRLLYVAMTRAKEKLFISYNKYYNNIDWKKSSFLEELDPNLYQSQIKKIFIKNEKKVFIKKTEKVKNFNFIINDIVEHPLFGKGVVVGLFDEDPQVEFYDKTYGKRIMVNSILKKIN